MNKENSQKIAIAAVVVTALGYFVDIYDLILFSVVRVPSLKSLGLNENEILLEGVRLLNLQMIGMLIGGVLFGVLGDKLGRLSVLFGSILVYSVANFLNAYVETVEQYAILRFIAGIGLAGELGAGITLVAECLPRNKRGLGTTIVASVGISGALLAWYVSHHFDWRTAYKVGGLMGFALLFLRVGVLESGIYQKTRESGTKRGDLIMLFTNRSRLKRLTGCIMMGLPTWYIVGILVTLSPEFSQVLGVLGPIEGGRAIFFCYSGLVIGDLFSGLLSQYLQSRKRSIFTLLSFASLTIVAYFTLRGLTPSNFYGLCFLLGIGGGYWAMFVTVSAEQFGTNLRSTVATSTPNFARGSLVLISSAFLALKEPLGLIGAGATVGAVVMIIGFSGVAILRESFHLDLDYEET